MKISLNWLKSLLESDRSADELASLFTSAGLEVEGRETVESVPGGLRGLVVGEVVECSKHPDADRLSITRVDVGNGAPLSIVCGAPNVARGQKVIVAKPGAKLFPLKGEPFEIKKSKIRGQLSEGMICAEDEIGVGESHEGIIVLPKETVVGKEAAEIYNVESDEVFEIGLTPNRSDAASHFGVARDLAAVLNSHGHTSKYVPRIPDLADLPEPLAPRSIKVEVLDKSACPRYCGIAISDISVKESPEWIQNRLRSIGVRPVNNVVDITNFVLHELGQPLHAFDLAKIKGEKIVVRRASPGETFVTLDGIERRLSGTDLMICDEQSPMCLAGVFGGAESGVTAQTHTVFLESAYFDPAAVRRTARSHSLRTDASFRFERGADPEMTITALKRAAGLILETAGGRIVSEVIDEYPEKLAPYKVAFSYKNCNELAGKDLDRAMMKAIITNLGIEIDSEGTDGLLLYVPRHKHDVTREADVIEEILRIYGYDNIEPARHLNFGLPSGSQSDDNDQVEKVGQLLSANGFREIMTLSLTNESYYNDKKDLVRVLNPLSSELGVMRKSLIPGGLASLAYNINRQADDLKLFEFGRSYTQNGSADYAEKKQLSIFVTGGVFNLNPHGIKSDDGFALLKSALGSIFISGGLGAVRTRELNDEAFQYGLEYINGRSAVAVAGLVSQELAGIFSLSQPVYCAVIEWEDYVRAASERKVIFSELSKFPFVTRDLALLIDKKVAYSQVEELAYQTEKKLLANVGLFDVYQDKKLGEKKSYAVRFTLTDRNATLTDAQIDPVMERLIRAFREKLGAELR